MKPLSFLELARLVIEEEKRPLSSDEIWEIAKAKGYDQQIGSKGNTPPATIGSRIYVDMRDSPQSVFIKVGARPRRFFLKHLAKQENIPVDGQGTMQPARSKSFAYLEKDLHAFLSYYANFRLKAYTKTINHTKSAKSEFGEWIHPDMIGCYFPIGEWESEVVEFSSVIGSNSIKLFSFEIKRELNFSNLREAFFQAVSNSSWANEGYLVAANISQDEEFLSELSRLSNSFGVGIISLNINEPDLAEILFPAQIKEGLDWDMLNKLAKMNSEIRAFLKRIKIDISSKEIRKEMYDRILSPDELKYAIRQERI